ncbi:MAG: hypothetical protein ACNA7H_10140, partial [Desulfotignum sp.]
VRAAETENAMPDELSFFFSADHDMILRNIQTKLKELYTPHEHPAEPEPAALENQFPGRG